ncbi:14651_t:CDS:1, partial [Gigaspora rosea]
DSSTDDLDLSDSGSQGTTSEEGEIQEPPSQCVLCCKQTNSLELMRVHGGCRIFVSA